MFTTSEAEQLRVKEKDVHCFIIFLRKVCSRKSPIRKMSVLGNILLGKSRPGNPILENIRSSNVQFGKTQTEVEVEVEIEV